MVRTAIKAAVLLLVACAPKASTIGKPEASAAPASPSIEVTHYRGLSRVALAGGQMVGTIDLLMKRTVDPGQSIITEQIAQKSSKQGEKPVEYTTTIRVSGNHFALSEPTLNITGEGDLTGEPWKWNRWTSRATLMDGSSVDSSFTRDPNGMKADKQVFGPLGVVRATLSESYQPIAAEVFEQERREMLGLHEVAPQ